MTSDVRTRCLLVAPPRSRNPLLADIVKRIGLAERTGRGIDRIYEDMLRYGRPASDYTMSDASAAVLVLPKSDADTAFLEMTLRHEERTGTAMPIDSLIILSRLRHERRLTTIDLSTDTQRSEQATRTALEKLVEAGLVEAHGTGRGRSYTSVPEQSESTRARSHFMSGDMNSHVNLCARRISGAFKLSGGLTVHGHGSTNRGG